MNFTKILTRFALSAFISLPMVYAANSQQIDGDGTTSVLADGKVFYKMPSTGAIVKRDVQLSVPSQGKGDVVLYVKSSSAEDSSTVAMIKADDFFSTHHNGRVVFYVVFKNPPHSPANTMKVFRGTYVRGTNVAIYSGEVFSRTYSSERSMRMVFTKDIIEFKTFDKVPSKFSYKAGFWFKAQVPAQAENENITFNGIWD